jgi:4-hydroxybenzoate polyprenyltransferase
MIKRLRQILEMIRFSHTLFALPFAMMAAVMAWTVLPTNGEKIAFRFQDLLGIVACMVAARSAAMAFNRLVDRRIDAANPRTEGRHLPQGTLPASSVLLFTCISSLAFVASTLLFLPNRLPILLSVPVLAFLLLYSFTKRFTSLAHFYLGASLMLAPVCAWIALRGELLAESPADILPALVIGLSVLLWVGGFDIIYACQDVEVDRQAHLHSVPARIGVSAALRLAALCHLAMLLVLLVLPQVDRLGGPFLPLGWIYHIGLLGVGGLLIYEHSVVRPDDLGRVNVAFFRVNVVVSVGLFFLVTLDLLTC